MGTGLGPLEATVHVDWEAEPLTEPLAPGSSPLLPVAARGARLLDRYRVEAVLCRGPSSVLLRARDVRGQRDVAIKLLAPDQARDPAHLDRFYRRAHALAALASDRAVRVLEIGAHRDGTPALVMELLTGPDLARRLEERGPQPPAMVVDWIIQACEALAEAHGLGAVHGDVALTHLVLTRDDDAPRVKLVSYAGDASADRRRTPRDDLRELGVAAYRLLAGHTPFRDAEPGLARGSQPPAAMRPLGVHLPHGLGDVVAKALAADATRGFATVADLARALAPYSAAPHLAWPAAERARFALYGPAVAQAMNPPSGTLSRRALGILALVLGAILGMGLAAWTAHAPAATRPGLAAPAPAPAPPPTAREPPVRAALPPPPPAAPAALAPPARAPLPAPPRPRRQRRSSRPRATARPPIVLDLGALADQ